MKLSTLHYLKKNEVNLARLFKRIKGGLHEEKVIARRWYGTFI